MNDSELAKLEVVVTRRPETRTRASVGESGPPYLNGFGHSQITPIAHL